jgi:hypothetical protein
MGLTKEGKSDGNKIKEREKRHRTAEERQREGMGKAEIR